MRRADVLQKLRAEQRKSPRYGVESLALFGSVARDEAGPNSDVDLLVEFGRPITLFDLVAVQQYLERCLGVRRWTWCRGQHVSRLSATTFSGRRCMSVDKRWQMRIEHILEAISKIQRYTMD